MKQASWTIDFWYSEANKLGIKDENARLKYAELCLREFENSAKLRVVDHVLETVVPVVAEFLEKD